MSYEKIVSPEEASFREAILQRLQRFSTQFHQVRERMGLDNRVGFGMLPEEHEVYTAGRLIEFKRGRKGTILFGSSGFLT